MECWGPWIWHTKCILHNHQTLILFQLSLKWAQAPAWNCWIASVHIHTSFVLIFCPHGILLIPHWSSLIVACCFQGKHQPTVLTHLRSATLAHLALATLNSLLFLRCMELFLDTEPSQVLGQPPYWPLYSLLSLHLNSPLSWLTKVKFPCLSYQTPHDDHSLFISEFTCGKNVFLSFKPSLEHKEGKESTYFAR